VRQVFADTLYWGAVLHPHDQYRVQVMRAREALGGVRLVTANEVLAELPDGFWAIIPVRRLSRTNTPVY
jgi:hypothetical protein